MTGLYLELIDWWSSTLKLEISVKKKNGPTPAGDESRNLKAEMEKQLIEHQEIRET